MADTIRIQMMSDFILYINEHRAEYIANKSRKGAALIACLIANGRTPVSTRRLLSAFWQDETLANPENALKTLISRLRAMLNELSPRLGACIVADRGAYHWECLPGMEVDLYEIERIFHRLHGEMAEDEAIALYRRLMTLYSGDLLYACDLNDWAMARAVGLHNQYVDAVLKYVALLKKKGAGPEIVRVCRSALDVDKFNDQLHIEMMQALVNEGRDNEAMLQYEEVTHLYYHYLNAEPSPEMKEFYQAIVASRRSIEFSLEAITRELLSAAGDQQALLCDYSVFKEIFNIHIRNAARMGVEVFLGIIMVSGEDGQSMDTMRQGAAIRSLTAILREHLRRGDIIAQVSPTIVAVLLPMVNYRTGDSVMERVRGLFYQQYPNSGVRFDYRISAVKEEKRQTEKKA